MANNYLESIGARILSEANDLKRTVESMANELGLNESHLKNVIAGNCSRAEAFQVIDKIEEVYPVDSSDLRLIQDNSEFGVLYFSAEKSIESSRIFNRKDKNGDKTPFYDYRDTAMSKLCPFKPEWIKELRVVKNSDPLNPDVAYNSGHFLHQTTFFYGPVNFYYEIDGVKYCKEMNTGDSNYITPYIPHSFSSRDESREAYIIAITFGGDVRRALKELYAIGGDRTNKYVLDLKNRGVATAQIIKQHMLNENMTECMLDDILQQRNINIDINSILEQHKGASKTELEQLANVFNIEPLELDVPLYNEDELVVICRKEESQPNLFPDADNKIYKIYNLARARKLSGLKGFDLEVLAGNIAKDNYFESSLHSYVNNYGEDGVTLVWEYEGIMYKKKLGSLDSATIQPFVKYGFEVEPPAIGKICLVRVSGSVNYCTQKELSHFSSASRVAKENQCWFES